MRLVGAAVAVILFVFVAAGLQRDLLFAPADAKSLVVNSPSGEGYGGATTIFTLDDIAGQLGGDLGEIVAEAASGFRGPGPVDVSRAFRSQRPLPRLSRQDPHQADPSPGPGVPGPAGACRARAGLNVKSVVSSFYGSRIAPNPYIRKKESP